MLKLIVILIAALVLEAIGVVFLSQGLKQAGELSQPTLPEVARLVMRCLSNGHFVSSEKCGCEFDLAPDFAWVCAHDGRREIYPS